MALAGEGEVMPGEMTPASHELMTALSETAQCLGYRVGPASVTVMADGRRRVDLELHPGDLSLAAVIAVVDRFLQPIQRAIRAALVRCPAVPSLPQAVLCYVNESWAYFTTLPLDRQSGEGWTRAPYEHNAMPPRVWRDGDGEPWRVIRVAYHADGLLLPCDGTTNSSWTVEKINAGLVPWLRTDAAPYRVIFAGTTLQTFMEALRALGGTVYLPSDLGAAEAGRPDA